jgi:uncharacterized protein (TIGR02118 family)
MIKLVFCLRRLPHLSRDEFQAYWRDKHASLVAGHADTLGIRRYVQTHADDHPVNAALAADRGTPEAYDGVAELWFDSYDALIAATTTAAGRVASVELLADEKKFIDLARSPLWLNREHVIVGD